MVDIQKDKFFGIPVWLLIVVAGLFVAVNQGWIDNPLGDGASAESLMAVDIELDSTFVNVSSNGSTLADVDTNYESDTGVITIPVDAEVSDDGSDSTFVLKTKDVSGNSVELLNFTNTGVLTVPSDDESIEFSMLVGLGYDDGFSSTNDIASTLVSAAAPGLVDDAGDDYYPIVVRSTDTDNPVVYVDGEEDENKYSWTASTSDQTIEITFNVSAGGIIQMGDLSSISVDTEFEAADEDFTINLIRISAL